MFSGRIKRWALLFQGNQFDILHRSVAILETADALSRLPLPTVTDSVPILVDWTNLINFLDTAPVIALTVPQQTRTDPLLANVACHCSTDSTAIINIKTSCETCGRFPHEGICLQLHVVVRFE